MSSSIMPRLLRKSTFPYSEKWDYCDAQPTGVAGLLGNPYGLDIASSVYKPEADLSSNPFKEFNKRHDGSLESIKGGFLLVDMVISSGAVRSNDGYDAAVYVRRIFHVVDIAGRMLDSIVSFAIGHSGQRLMVFDSSGCLHYQLNRKTAIKKVLHVRLAMVERLNFLTLPSTGRSVVFGFDGMWAERIVMTIPWLACDIDAPIKSKDFMGKLHDSSDKALSQFQRKVDVMIAQCRMNIKKCNDILEICGYSNEMDLHRYDGYILNME